MVRFAAGSLSWMLLVLALCPASEPPAKETPAKADKILVDTWDIAYLDGQRTGHVHTLVRESDLDGKTVYRSTVAMQMVLRRFDDVIQQQVSTGTVETKDGKVLGVSMTQALGKQQQMELTGIVEGDHLHVTVAGDLKIDKNIPWNSEATGLYSELRLFQDKKSKPGDSFTYLHYEPSINAVVKVVVNVKEPEEVEIDHVKRKLLRIESQAERFMGVQLPLTVFWLDKDLEVIRSQMDMPGLGKLITLRSTKEAALKPVTPAKITDVGLTQLIKLNKKIPAAHATRSVVYKITLPEDEEPGKAVATDARQEIQNVKGKSFELHVQALRQPRAIKDAAPAADQFLKSNYFINSADDKVKELAKLAVGTEKDPWKKALKIELWVHKNMKSTNFSEAMATADHVARTLEGDCTEYAMLTAAMCRAVAVPSRTALGLVYADMDKGKVQGPVLAYHMWTEVYVDGQWLALDAVLGRGGIGAGHVKITDHSWHEQRSLAPLLPVMRFMLAKPTIEVVDVEWEK